MLNICKLPTLYQHCVKLPLHVANNLLVPNSRDTVVSTHNVLPMNATQKGLVSVFVIQSSITIVHNLYHPVDI